MTIEDIGTKPVLFLSMTKKTLLNCTAIVVIDQCNKRLPARVNLVPRPTF